LGLLELNGLAEFLGDNGSLNDSLGDVLDFLDSSGGDDFSVNNWLDLFDDARFDSLLDDGGLDDGVCGSVLNNARGLLVLHDGSGSASHDILALLCGENSLLDLSGQDGLLEDGLSDLVNLSCVDFTVDDGLHLLCVDWFDDLFHGCLVEDLLDGCASRTIGSLLLLSFESTD